MNKIRNWNAGRGRYIYIRSEGRCNVRLISTDIGRGRVTYVYTVYM